MLPSRGKLPVVGLLLLAAVAVPRAGAQKQLAPLNELKEGHAKAFTLVEKFITGQQAPTAADKEFMEAEAKYLVYRFSCGGDLGQYQSDIKNWIIKVELPANRKTNGPFIRMMSPILVKACRELLDQDFLESRHAIINFAPMLAQLAKLRDEAIAEYLVELLADHEAAKGKLTNKHDVIKMYAAKALREYFPIAVVSEDDEVLTDAQTRRKAREIKHIEALIKFIDRPAPKRKLDKEEEEAIRFLRREAIETLARAEAPSVLAGKKQVEAPVAPILLRVLSPNGGIEPTPGLAERVEAAIGICQIKYAKVPEYQPQLGVYLVGVLIEDLAKAYNKDLVEILGAGKKAPAMYWRVSAKRLDLAVKDMVVNAKGQPVETNVKKLSEGAAPILERMLSAAAKQPGAVDQTVLFNFGKMVNTMKPPANTVFKNVSTYKIELNEGPQEKPAPP
jgi:hypothetical protein